jgi:hypothetical protein
VVACAFSTASLFSSAISVALSGLPFANGMSTTVELAEGVNIPKPNGA